MGLTGAFHITDTKAFPDKARPLQAFSWEKSLYYGVNPKCHHSNNDFAELVFSFHSIVTRKMARWGSFG